MRKIILILFFLFFINSSLYAIDKTTAKEAIQWKALITVTDALIPYAHRGIVIDVQTIEGEDYLLLQTYYYDTPRLFIRLSKISTILKIQKLRKEDIIGIYTEKQQNAIK